MLGLRVAAERLTYANVVATLALFIALGGASYAVVALPDHSVGARQLANGAVGAEALSFPLAVSLLRSGPTIYLHQHRCSDQPPGTLPANSCEVLLTEAVPLGHLTLKRAGKIALIATATVEEGSPHDSTDTALLTLLVNKHPVGSQVLEVPDSRVPHQIVIEAVAPGRAGSNSVGFYGGASYYGSAGDGALQISGLSTLAIALPTR